MPSHELNTRHCEPTSPHQFPTPATHLDQTLGLPVNPPGTCLAGNLFPGFRAEGAGAIDVSAHVSPIVDVDVDMDDQMGTGKNPVLCD